MLRFSLKLEVTPARRYEKLGACSGSIIARFVADPGSCLEQLCSLSVLLMTCYVYTGCY